MNKVIIDYHNNHKLDMLYKLSSIGIKYKQTLFNQEIENL